MILSLAVLGSGLFIDALAARADGHKKTHRCVVPHGAADDSPAIVKAFEDCKAGGTVVFQNATYNVGTIMQTMGLQDVKVQLEGTLLVSLSLRIMDHFQVSGRH
jgi:hypothetical protein